MIEIAPALFVSHGAPTFALEPGQAGALLQALGRRLAKPKAILAVSPHWMTPELSLTTSANPDTLHDFGGFPRALYFLQYPAPGDPELAGHVFDLLQKAHYSAMIDSQRGLDHGVWVPLCHLYPQADVPVVQLSLPEWADGPSAWRLGEVLSPLRREGVMILGSGSLTHNLYEVRWNDSEGELYAREFVAWARDKVVRHDRDALVNFMEQAPHARRAHPTPEHFLPLLVAAGAGGIDSRVEVLDGGITHGVLSMDSYLFV
jgi:4,5-DOPA dioxygenase extradiol